MSDKDDTWYCKELGVKIPPVAKLTDFFETYCSEEIITLLESYPNIIEDYSEGEESSEGEEFPKDKEYPEKKTIHIKYPDLYKFNRGLGIALINNFYDTTNILQKALDKVKVIKGSNKEINLDEKSSA